MAFMAGTGERRPSTPARSSSGLYKSERMSYWRWLLFAAMARLELREDRYFRIPNARAIRRDVTVDLHPDRERIPASVRRPVAEVDDRIKHVAFDSRLAPMRLASWLEPQRIVLDCELRDRRHALESAAAEIGSMHRLDPEPILRALWRRELVGSTALGCGVAIPHARIGGIERPMTLFMRSQRAIDFDAPDGKAVDNILVIMVPSDGDTDDHLQLLALVAQMFADGAFRGRVAAATDTTEARGAFADWRRANCTTETFGVWASSRRIEVGTRIVCSSREMKAMSDQGPTILIFGAETGSRGGEAGTLGSNRVPVETIKANLKTVMDSVSDLVLATRGAPGVLRVCHVDVGVASALDGSVGLVGTGTGASTEATLKLRLKRAVAGSRTGG